MSELLQKDSRVIWHPFTQASFGEPPLPIVRSQGARLYLEDGSSIIDGISSWWANLHGHCHPHISAAVASQIQRLDHVLFAGCTHEPAVQLAESLLRLLPQNQQRIFYSDSGSTAVEAAVKIAIQYWCNLGQPRKTIVTLHDGYHGDTLGAMSVGGRGPFARPFEPFLFNVEHLSIHGNEGDIARCNELAKRGDVAAFIFEPGIQAVAGMKIFDLTVIDRYVEILTSCDALTICDECMTGFGRTGVTFVAEQLTREPDLMCLAKGLSGGVLPLAVTSCTEEVFQTFVSADISKTFFHGHTFTANPVACAAANASMELLDTPDCRKEIARITGCHQRFAQEIERSKRVQNVRTRGTLVAFDVAFGEGEGYLNNAGRELYPQFIRHGVLLRPLGQTVYILPPYCISNGELEEVYGVVMEILGS